MVDRLNLKAAYGLPNGGSRSGGPSDPQRRRGRHPSDPRSGADTSTARQRLSDLLDLCVRDPRASDVLAMGKGIGLPCQRLSAPFGPAEVQQMRTGRQKGLSSDERLLRVGMMDYQTHTGLLEAR